MRSTGSGAGVAEDVGDVVVDVALADVLDGAAL
jgi:hypothetical protein